MISPPRVRLYTKAGCHLCEQAEADLERLRARYPHSLQRVDITGQAELVRRYGERIPVLVVGAHEYSAPLPAALIERALAEGARSAALEQGEPRDSCGAGA